MSFNIAGKYILKNALYLLKPPFAKFAAIRSKHQDTRVVMGCDRGALSWFDCINMALLGYFEVMIQNLWLKSLNQRRVCEGLDWATHSHHLTFKWGTLCSADVRFIGTRIRKLRSWLSKTKLSIVL